MPAPIILWIGVLPVVGHVVCLTKRKRARCPWGGVAMHRLKRAAYRVLGWHKWNIVRDENGVMWRRYSLDTDQWETRELTDKEREEDDWWTAIR